jgi:hypothetical protein
MPVHIRPDEELPAPARDVDPNRDRAEMFEGIGASVRAAMNCVIVGGILLSVGLRAMRPAMLAAEKLLLRGGDYWKEAITPGALFILYGIGFGCALGWRMGAWATLTAGLMWAIGSGALLLLAGAGALGAMLVYPDGVPYMVWINLGLMMLAGLPGLYFMWNWGA